MLEDSKKSLEIEITDLVTGLPFTIGKDELHEFDGLSYAARIESITFNGMLMLNTKITDRSYKDIKELCQLFIDHNEEETGFQFYAVLVAYLLNTALTADQAYSFVLDKMKLEVKEADLINQKISITSLFKQTQETKSDLSNLITSSIGGYKYLFAPPVKL